MKRLNIGIDLALTGKHRASVYNPQTQEYLDKSFSFDASYKGYEYLWEQVKKHFQENEEVEMKFVMEPTSLAWLPLSCYLSLKKKKVYRISTQKSSDLRKFLERHTKSDRIDTRALALSPELDKKGIYELYLPSFDLGTLTRKCKHMAKLVKEVSAHKLRIQSIFTMLNPEVLEVFKDNKFTVVGKTFLKNYSNPFKIINMGKEAFFKEFKEKSKRKIKENVLKYIYATSESTCKIYEPLVSKGIMPCDFNEVADEIQVELRIIETLEEEVKDIQKSIDAYYEKLDPAGILKTIRGIGDRIAPAIIGLSGDIKRFSNIRKYKKFFGFVPRKKQSSEKDKKGLKICKAAQGLLKSYVYMASETARHWDPEFAAFYNRLRKKGHHHIEAMCALGNKMAGRIYAILKRLQNKENVNPDELVYKIRDEKGNFVSKKEARRIIKEKYPSKSEQEKIAKQKRHEEKKSMDKNRRERVPQFTDISRQSPNTTGINSLQKKGNPLPAKVIIENILSGAYLQDPTLTKHQKDFYSKLVSLWENIPVNNLCIDKKKNCKKKLDMT